MLIRRKAEENLLPENNGKSFFSWDPDHDFALKTKTTIWQKRRQNKAS